MQSLPQQPSRRVAVVALAILLLALCGRVDSFGPPRPAVCSTRKGKPAGLLLAVPKATSSSDEEHVSRPGPVIPNWSNFRVPTEVVPYGLNVEIMNDKLQSQPRDGVVTSMVWGFGGQKYIHPELRSDFPVGQWLDKRANLGIALSGGGMRAASTCLGWLRGLNELGLLSKARYISSNSGATWVTVPLAAKQLLDKKEYQKDLDYEKYLGKYMDPENITGSEEELGEIGRILRDSDILKKKGTGEVRSFTTADGTSGDFTSWVEAIDENFVQPMKIVPCPDYLKDMGDAYLWNDNAKRLDDKTFPFPIFVGTAYPALKQRVTIAVPFEFTPLYVGIPIDPRIHNNMQMDIGGGYTQSIAFNSHVTNKGLTSVPPWKEKEHPLHLYQLPLPTKVFKATEMTGISSSFFAAAEVSTTLPIDKIIRRLPFIPDFLKKFPNPASYQYWSPISGGESMQLNFADGGIYDNTGVLGLVRRGCKTVIACVSSDAAVVVDNPESQFSDIAALFGRAPQKSGGPIASVNEMQIFDSKHWDDLLSGLKKNYTAGEPQVCKMNLEVYPNEKAGVYEGGTVEIYFCVNGRCTGWYDTLGPKAESLKKMMKQSGWPWGPFTGPEGMLRIVPDLFKSTKLTNHFPYFSTFRVIYDQNVVNMMAHNCAFAIKTGLEKYGFDVEKSYGKRK